MPNPLENGQGVIFMKVGLHASESLEDIVKRKRREYEEAGSIFWGYGGSSCHPRTMVQPFGKSMQEEGKHLLIIMNEMNSKHAAPPVAATHYSKDGVDWEAVPRGIEVRGSRFALVLDELRLDEFEVNLNDFEVGLGQSRGKAASEYLKGQNDKGCLIYHEPHVPPPPEEQIVKRIGLIARVKPPFAVFLKN
ncbi:hypothetical protein C4K26_0021 [Pseudomonas chlororaphis]|uniref:hypothetical protein n=1 Tax=Pseudomonas chlororaphis TaxID=587753 RepID=UPI000F55EA91|nr:hypothetical protein [Pseudomonas chlororaphis]AZD05462.1 hypothetical protein C4K26_0021 [Pseudomonas chlororaphis]